MNNREAMKKAFKAKYDELGVDTWNYIGYEKIFEYGWQAALASQAQQPTLAKNQPCGCVICTCEHETQCQGCGAKHCRTHAVGNIPNPIYLQSQAQQPTDKFLADAKNHMLTALQKKLSTGDFDSADIQSACRSIESYLKESQAQQTESKLDKIAESYTHELIAMSDEDVLDGLKQGEAKKRGLSMLDCIKVKMDNHDKFHELLESILNAGERVAMPVSFLSIINDAGMKFIKSLPPAPEGEKNG